MMLGMINTWWWKLSFPDDLSIQTNINDSSLVPADVHVLGVECLAEKDHREVRYAEGEDASPEAGTTSYDCLEKCSFMLIFYRSTSELSWLDSGQFAFSFWVTNSMH